MLALETSMESKLILNLKKKKASEDPHRPMSSPRFIKFCPKKRGGGPLKRFQKKKTKERRIKKKSRAKNEPSTKVAKKINPIRIKNAYPKMKGEEDDTFFVVIGIFTGFYWVLIVSNVCQMFTRRPVDLIEFYRVFRHHWILLKLNGPGSNPFP